MAVERPPSAIWFVLRIKMQHYSRDFAREPLLGEHTREILGRSGS
jgi:hypothetical protein